MGNITTGKSAIWKFRRVSGGRLRSKLQIWGQTRISKAESFGRTEKERAAEGGVTKLPETSPAEVPAFALPYVVNALPMSTAATYRSMAGAGR